MSIDTEDAIGRLVVDYLDNEKKIAALRSTVGSIGREMRQVGIDLWEHPEDVDLTETGIIPRHGTRETLQRDFADVLFDALENLKDAMDVKSKQEKLLRQAGYEHAIRSPDRDR